jgi:hypothetical protein
MGDKQNTEGINGVTKEEEEGVNGRWKREEEDGIIGVSEHNSEEIEGDEVEEEEEEEEEERKEVGTNGGERKERLFEMEEETGEEGRLLLLEGRKEEEEEDGGGETLSTSFCTSFLLPSVSDLGELEKSSLFLLPFPSSFSDSVLPSVSFSLS